MIADPELTEMRQVVSGRERDSSEWPAPTGDTKRDFSHSQADAFARANAQEKVGLLRSK